LNTEGLVDNDFSPDSDAYQNALDGIHFKSDRMYHHSVMRINYTTYDVWRSQDTINPNSNHCNVMLLSSHESGSPKHQYIYARVLGIFHVNVIYAGPGMSSYQARQLDFLWVRWFEGVDDILVSHSWVDARLDRLQFPPMSDHEAFGFIDPAHVLCGCHIIPRFAIGLRHVEGMGISECAANDKDWHHYYVAQSVAQIQSDCSWQLTHGIVVSSIEIS
jgi:hypothetical protein